MNMNMRLKMKYLPVPLLMMFAILSCAGEDEEEQTRVPVELTGWTFPAEGRVGDIAELHFEASAPNGCYSDIVVQLTETAPNTIHVKASANYSGKRNCSDAVVEADTVIAYSPARAGELLIRINDSPFQVTEQRIAILP